MYGFSSYSDYRHNRRPRPTFSGLLRYIFVAFLALVLVQIFVFQTFAVGSSDMNPNYQKNDRLLAIVFGVKNPFTNRYLVRYRQPGRGEAVIVSPGYLRDSSAILQNIDVLIRLVSFQRLSLYHNQRHVTPGVLLRVAGVPGDELYLQGNVLFVRPAEEDRFIREYDLPEFSYQIDSGSLPEFWPDNALLGRDHPHLILGENQYFLLADSRMAMNDSRSWGILPSESFLARPILRYWPLTLPGRR